MDKTILLRYIADAVKAAPQINPLLSGKTAAILRFEEIKAAALSRDEIERKLTRAIAQVEKRYLDILKKNEGRVPFGFWREYESDMQAAISGIMRQQIETSLVEDNDYTYLLDVADSNTKIDAAITAAILAIVLGMSRNTQATYNELAAQGVAGMELIDRIALRFSSGHAEQIAVTELTRAGGEVSQVLSDMLTESGLPTQIRLTTSVDERVCPICGPADHKLRDEPINTATGGWNGQTWGGRFGNVPFHVNCRCKTRVETVRK